MKAPKVNQAEDKILDDYLAGKSHLSDSYKQIALDLPGVEIDSSILAASRREVNACPKPLGAEGWRKWQMPFSIAAVLVISASLTLTMVDFQNKSDDIPIESTSIVIKEESKDIRGDSFGQGKPEVTEANKTSASPVRKLEPVERMKQKMAQPETPSPKLADTKTTQNAKAPSAKPPTETKSELSAQAFPAVTAKSIDADVAATENAVLNEQASARSGQSAPVPATAQGVAGSVAEKAPVPVAPAPAPAPVLASAAPAPTVATTNDTAISVEAKSARSAASASAAMSAETSRTVAAPASRKTEAQNESTTAATYAAAQTWLGKIEALLRDGKTEEAEQTLAEFKQRFPNYVTPDAIKEELAKQRAVLNVEPVKQ